MAPHMGSATPEQIDALLNFLDEHRDLAQGRLRSIEGKVQAKRLWDELCITLNSMGGCTKTVQQWQKVWFDRKHLAKKAAAESRRSGLDVRSRLFQLEAERAERETLLHAELINIKDALLQLCGLIREYLDRHRD